MEKVCQKGVPFVCHIPGKICEKLFRLPHKGVFFMTFYVTIAGNGKTLVASDLVGLQLGVFCQS